MDRNYNAPHIIDAVCVALRKESVDRNHVCSRYRVKLALSLSARRAWIEILLRCTGRAGSPVALRKESVDRNTEEDTHTTQTYGRSPQGERG